MKNASRSKFLLCFRLVDDMETAVDSKPTRRARTKLIDNTKLEKTNKIINEVKPPPPLIKTMSLDRDSSMITTPPPSRHNRTLSKAFKAIFFGTILAKKAKKARAGKALRQHSLKRDYTPSETNSDDVSDDDATHASVSLNSAKQRSKNQGCVKKSKKSEKGSCDFNLGMCLLLMSLGITVFWGRVFAILFTSIWLYVFSWSCTENSDPWRPEKGEKWSEEEFREQKRRVIMEGLIERNHHSQSSQRWH